MTRTAATEKLFILGVDAMDPRLTQKLHTSSDILMKDFFANSILISFSAAIFSCQMDGSWT